MKSKTTILLAAALLGVPVALSAVSATAYASNRYEWQEPEPNIDAWYAGWRAGFVAGFQQVKHHLAPDPVVPVPPVPPPGDPLTYDSGYTAGVIAGAAYAAAH